MKSLILALAVVFSVTWSPQARAMGASRSFSMGFATRTSDSDDSGIVSLIQKHGDLIVVQDDNGIPWDAALAGNYAAYPADYLQNLQNLAAQVKARTPGTKVFLYMNFLNGWRKGISDYRIQGGTADLSTTSWASKAIAFNDPQVLQAYLNHVAFLTAIFQPDYLAYGTEVNMLADYVSSGQVPVQAWFNFVEAAGFLHTVLKGAFPNLPIFVSVQADYFNKNRAVQTQALSQIWSATDYLAISSYPYGMNMPDMTKMPADYYSALVALAPGKPFAIAEMGWAATPVFYPDPLPPGGTYQYYIDENAYQQELFMSRMLQEATKNNAVFIDWYEPQDIDKVYATLPDGVFKSIVRSFRNMGLWDQYGNIRTSGLLWEIEFEFFKLTGANQGGQLGRPSRPKRN